MGYLHAESLSVHSPLDEAPLPLAPAAYPTSKIQPCSSTAETLELGTSAGGEGPLHG